MKASRGSFKSASSKSARLKAAPRRKRDRHSTEERLIQAATEVFSQLGYDAATTKMISKAAEVNESLIMRYFGSKEGLLLEIIRRFFATANATPLNYAPQETLEKEIKHYLKQAFSTLSEHHAIFRIMLLRASVDPKLRKQVLALMALGGDPKLKERLEILRSNGRIPPALDERPLHLVTFLCISTIFISEILFEREKQKEIQQGIDFLLEHLIKSLLEEAKTLKN